MSARSKASGVALHVLAEEERDPELVEPRGRRPSMTSPSLTIARRSLGTSMPTVVLPGIGATIRTLGTARAIARSFGQR